MNEGENVSIRRAYPRMDVRIPVRIQQADSQPISGVTLNLSRSGVLVRLEGSVEAGARYLIQFLKPEPFDVMGGTACEKCGAVPTPQVVPQQTVWARALRQGTGASDHAAAFEFETLLEVVHDVAA